jgi:hypothetical protein
MPPKLCSLSQAAAPAGVSDDTLRRWLAAGDVPEHVYVKLNGRLYFRRIAWLAWLDGEEPTDDASIGRSRRLRAVG